MSFNIPCILSYWDSFCSLIRVRRGTIWNRRPWVSRFHCEKLVWIFWILSKSDNSFSSWIISTSTSTWFSLSFSSVLLLDNKDDDDDDDDDGVVLYVLHFIFASAIVSIMWVAWCDSVCPAATISDNSLNWVESYKIKWKTKQLKCKLKLSKVRLKWRKDGVK